MSLIEVQGSRGVPAASAEQVMASTGRFSNSQSGGKETFTSGTAVNMLPHYTVARWLQCINLCHMHVFKEQGQGTFALNERSVYLQDVMMKS